MKHNNYMTTGELAKIMGITKHTLFHYDDIGLFKPQMKDEKGYRFYSVEQMETLDTILVLKDLDIPLNDIKKLMKNRNHDHIVEILNNHQHQIQNQIQKLNKMNHWIEQKKKSILTSCQEDFSNITIKHYPSRYYLYNTISDDSNQNFYKATNELITHFVQRHPYHFYQVAYIQYDQDFQNNDFDIYNNVSLLLYDPPQEQNYKILPEGQYLVAYHKGNWKNIKQTIQKLLDYKKVHHLICDELYVEHYVVDHLLVQDPRDYITEISVRII